MSIPNIPPIIIKNEAEFNAWQAIQTLSVNLQARIAEIIYDKIKASKSISDALNEIQSDGITLPGNSAPTGEWEKEVAKTIKEKITDKSYTPVAASISPADGGKPKRSCSMKKKAADGGPARGRARSPRGRKSGR